MGRELKSIRWGGTKRKRSDDQKAQLLAARAGASTSSLTPSHAVKENVPVSELQQAKERGDNYQRQLYNGRKKLKSTHKVIDTQTALLSQMHAETGDLRAEVAGLGEQVMELKAESSSLRAEVGSLKSMRSQMSKKMHTLQEKIRRIPSRLEKAISKTKLRAADDLSHAPYLNLKENGVIPDDTRDMINDLVALDGVRPHRVIDALKRMAGKLGIRVQGNASDRSVRRVVKEGGLASQLQFIEAVGTSKGVPSITAVIICV